MKYASRLAALALSLAMLTACGGGGSSSGSTGGGSDSPYYKSMVAGNEGSAIGVAAYDNLANVNAEDATTMAYQGVARMARTASNPMEFKNYEDEATITRTADGFQLVVSDEYDNGLPGRTINWKTFKEMDNADYQAMMTALEVNPNFIGSLSGKYLVSAEVSGERDITSVYDDGTFVGDVSRVDMLMLGGKNAGLEFSDFGGWAVVEFFVGTIDGTESNGHIWSEFNPLWNGDNSKATGVAGLSSGDTHFSGKVIGGAFTDGNEDVPMTLISGDANLDLNLANGEMTLEAIFDQFYTFNITNVPFDTFGATSYHSSNNTGAQVTATDNGNTTGINLAGKTLTLRKFDSQFYGSTSDKASEAVGSFDIRTVTGSGNERLLYGAFGVKR